MRNQVQVVVYKNESFMTIFISYTLQTDNIYDTH